MKAMENSLAVAIAIVALSCIVIAMAPIAGSPLQTGSWFARSF